LRIWSGLDRDLNQRNPAAAYTGWRAGDTALPTNSTVSTRNPRPSEAYSEAVKAVEAAAIPVVTPYDQKAPLGKIIGEMRSSPGRYSTAFADAADLGRTTITPVEAVIATLDLLWKNHTDRHGVPGPIKPVTPEKAENAAYLALLLARLFTTGGARRV
jgi:hypothetical protein